MNFSRTKKKIIPERISKETKIFDSIASNDSGIRWIIASPNSAPTAKLTKNKIIIFNFSFLRTSVKIPAKETKLTTKTLVRLYIQTFIAKDCSMRNYILPFFPDGRLFLFALPEYFSKIRRNFLSNRDSRNNQMKKHL